jgi:hypothetical protein
VQIKQQIITPPDTTTIRIWCIGGSSLDEKNPGVTWFDDVKILLIPPNVEDIHVNIILYFDIELVKPWWVRETEKP